MKQTLLIECTTNTISESNNANNKDGAQEFHHIFAASLKKWGF